MKIHPLGAELYHVGRPIGRNDETKSLFTVFKTCLKMYLNMNKTSITLQVQ